MMLRLKTRVRRSEFLRRNKYLWHTMRRVYRFGKYYPVKVLGTLKKEKRNLLYIDPHAVTRGIPGKNEPWEKAYPLPETMRAILKQRQNQVAYAQIPEFSQNVARIEDGTPIDDCTTEREYLARWRKIEDLCQTIQRDGYKTQAELHTSDLSDEVQIQVNHQGELLLETGLTRLTIAQHLGLQQVPMIVTRRHQEWENLRQDILKIIVQRGFFHQPFDHPDLDTIPKLYGARRADTATYGNERWDYIVDSLPITSGTVLDIGSYFGYFAHRFEDLGFECYAIEPDKENLAVLKRYRRLKGKKFQVWEKSLFDIERFEFDIILALNIFHHLVKTRYEYEQLLEFLGKIRCQAMYFEPQQIFKDTYKSFSDQEFVNFVLSNSVLNHSRWLGHAKEGRDVYLLTV